MYDLFSLPLSYVSSLVRGFPTLRLHFLRCTVFVLDLIKTDLVSYLVTVGMGVGKYSCSSAVSPDTTPSMNIKLVQALFIANQIPLLSIILSMTSS